MPRYSPWISIAAIVGAALLLAPVARAVEPYGTHDAGGFRNVLPPGEAGTDNAAQLAQFQLDGTYPDHWTDQQPLYDDLISASPRLTNAQVPNYFKDATFGVKQGQVESTTTPRAGVTIIRDRPYGVPHIYGDTRADVMFGQGYAGAQDRLFLMDILRHTGRAQLSSFIGGSPSNRAMDRVQWQLAPYIGAGPSVPDRPGRGVLRSRGRTARERRAELRRRDQRLHHRGAGGSA